MKQMLNSVTRRLFVAAALSTGLVGSTFSPSFAQVKKPDQVRIVFVTHGQANDNYWTVVKNGMMAAADALKVKVEYQAPERFDVVRMAQMIQAATASKPDGLVVSIPDATALEEPIKAAKASGIPVVVIDSGGEVVKPWGLDLYVGGGSEYDNGVKSGEIMGKAGVKHAMCVNHEVGNVSLDDRCRGLADGLKATGGKTSVVTVSLDPTDASRRVEGFMAANRDADGMLLLNANLAGPMMTMLEERGFGGKVKIGSFDLSPEVLDGLEKGKVLFGIDSQQYLMGYLPVVFLAGKAMYKTLPVADVMVGPTFVMKNEAGAIKKLSEQGIR